jgi:hypothetical protein
METIKLGRYKHHSGKLVEVKYIAKHWDTHEDLVVYHYSDSDSMLVTPLTKFLEEINIKGKIVPAFEYIG